MAVRHTDCLLALPEEMREAEADVPTGRMARAAAAIATVDFAMGSTAPR